MRLTLAFLLCVIALPLLANEAEKENERKQAKLLVDSLQFQKGDIKISDGIARLEVPDTFRFLNTPDSQRVLTELWGNPPESAVNVLGMLVPADVKLDGKDSWAVILTYEAEGFVKDDDAGKLDYGKLLKEMQEDVREGNEERKKSGYPAVELVGWATPPRYDQATHKLYWAKLLRFDDAKEETLNYNIRILGRKGVLVLNAVASKDKLSEVEGNTPAILSMVEFTDGNRYTDFRPGADKVAAYGLGALIAGKIAVKVGLFAMILKWIIAMKKLLFVAGAGLLALLRKLFGGGKAAPVETPSTDPPAATSA